MYLFLVYNIFTEGKRMRKMLKALIITIIIIISTLNIGKDLRCQTMIFVFFFIMINDTIRVSERKTFCIHFFLNWFDLLMIIINEFYLWMVMNKIFNIILVIFLNVEIPKYSFIHHILVERFYLFCIQIKGCFPLKKIKL